MTLRQMSPPGGTHAQRRTPRPEGGPKTKAALAGGLFGGRAALVLRLI